MAPSDCADCVGPHPAFEAIPPLAEALDSRSRETRIAAVRGLGRIARMDAAIPILERMLTQLDVPEHTLKSALVKCCNLHPSILVNYVERSHGAVRQLLARVLESWHRLTWARNCLCWRPTHSRKYAVPQPEL